MIDSHDEAGHMPVSFFNGEYGWHGFVFAAVFALVLLALLNTLAARARPRRRNSKSGRAAKNKKSPKLKP
jgi:hypothetical protein